MVIRNSPFCFGGVMAIVAPLGAAEWEEEPAR